MLSPDDQLYFIHIPKTAGTTLIALLDSKFDVNEIFPAQLWKELAKVPPDQIDQYRLYRGHFGSHGLDPFLPKRPVCITMLRDPIPLSLSTYKFVLREPGTRVHKLAASENMSFSDFIQHPKTRRRISNKQTRNLSYQIQQVPPEDSVFQYSESRDRVDQWLDKYRLPLSDQESLEQAKVQLDECACFGLVERFDESMALLSYTFGWAPVGTVPKLREATTPAEIEGLSADTRAMLEKCNRLDLKLYRYAERQFEKQMAAMVQHLHEFAKPGEPRPETWTEQPEVMNTLLDRYYTECQRQHLTPKSRIQVDFSRAWQGSGWHQREKMAVDDSVFRWTGPSTTATLDLPLSHKADATLALRVINAVDMDILESLSLSVNDQPVPLKLVDGAGTLIRTYEAIAPQAVLESDRPFVRLGLTVDRTLAPSAKEEWNPDTRKLGVAVHWVEARSHQDLAGSVPDRERIHEFASAAAIAKFNQRTRRRDRLKNWVKTAPVLRSVYKTYKKLTAQ
jgi:hypothetical protein